MKWNKENKKRLYCLVYDKITNIKGDAPRHGAPPISVQNFFEDFGIVRVFGVRVPSRDCHLRVSKRPKNGVVILDPWCGLNPRTYHLKTLKKLSEFEKVIGVISIPKDVAEKFLVLGVP